MSEFFTPITPAVALLAVSLVATAWMTLSAWTHRRRRHVVPLGVLNGLAFAWALLALIYHLLDASGPRHVLLDLRYVPITLLPVAWLAFSWTAAGLPRLSLRGIALISVVPAMTLFLLASNSMHGLMFSALYELPSRWSVVVGHEFGPWFWVHTAYSYVLFVAGAVLVGMMWFRSHPVLRPKVALLFVGALAPAMINVLYLTNQSTFGFVDLSPVGFAITTLCYGACVFRFRILELTPVPIGRVLDSMEEPRVMLTPTGRILDINRSAEALFEAKASDIVGSYASGPIRDLWRKRGEVGVIKEIELTGLDGAGWFELVLTPIRISKTEEGELASWLLQLRDIGQRKARQFELESQLASMSADSTRQATALEALHSDFGPRLAGIRGLAGAVAEEVDGEPEGFSRLIEGAATTMESTLLRHLDAAQGRSSADGSGLPRRPSRAPVPRSGEGPRASGKPAEDQTR
jgi:PAS domain-containing protein